MNTVYTKQFRGSGFITSVKYNKNGDSIFISDKDSHCVSKVNSSDMSEKIVFKGHKGIIWNFGILDNDDLISCSGDMTVKFWKNNGDIIKNIDENGIPKHISISNNKALIYCEAFSKRSQSYFAIYDILTHEKIKTIIVTEKTTSLKLKDEIAIIGCENGNLKLLNIDTEEYLKDEKIHNNAIKSVVISERNGNILTSSIDKTSKILDFDFNVLHILKSNGPINFAVYYAKDKKVLLGGGIEAMLVAMAKTETNDLKTKIYNIKSEKLVTQFSSHFGPLRCIDVFDKQFVTAGQDGLAKIHSFEKFVGCDEIINTEDMKNKKKIDEKKEKIYIVGMNNEKKNISFYEKSNDDIQKKEIVIVKRTLKLSNLPEDIDDRQLYEEFDIFGRIDGRIKVVRLENNYGNSNLFKNIIAYINFTEPECAEKAFERKTENKYILSNSVVNIELIEGKYYN
jgi:hypothetical protein